MVSTSRRRRRADAAIATSLMFAPAVIAMRLPIIALEAALPFHAARPESLSAISEKVAAVTDGLAAAQMAWWKAAMTLPFAMTRASDPAAPLADMANAVAAAALRPAARQVQRNMKRLSHKR